MGWTTIMKMCKHGARGRCYCYFGETCKRYEAWDSDKIKEENNMNKKELKMGDIVEIHETQITCHRLNMYSHFTSWVESVFVKYGEDDSIIVVDERNRNNFLDGEAFTTKKYSKPLWRIPKQKTYRPFTWEEREQLRGKWVKWKGADTEHFITTITKEKVLLMDKNDWLTFEELCKNCVFVDSGLPCGVEETK